MICVPNQILVLVRWQIKGQWNLRGILRVWGRSEIHTRFWWEHQKKEHYIEGLYRMHMPCIYYSPNHAITYAWFEESAKMHPEEIGRHGTDMISVTQHWVKWEAFVNTVTKLRVPENDDNFLIIWGSMRYFRLWPRWDRSCGPRCGVLLHNVNFWCSQFFQKHLDPWIIVRHSAPKRR